MIQYSNDRRYFVTVLVLCGFLLGCHPASENVKVKAFRKVIATYHKIPSELSSDAERTRFNKDLQRIQNEFIDIEFDVKKGRKEAKQIVRLFEDKIEGQYSGTTYNELTLEIGEIIDQLIE